MSINSFNEKIDGTFAQVLDIQLALPAIEKGGGKILASTNDIVAKENGVKEQTVLIEFESLEKALQAYESPEYQEALKALDGGAERDFRIFEGL